MTMVPITVIEDAIDRVSAFEGEAEEFVLPVADTLLDPLGINLAIVTDHILEKGWEPDGFEQRDGYRVFHYRTIADR